MAAARHFKHSQLPFIPAKTADGETSIARVINQAFSRHIGGGLEVLDGVAIHWTVTYDEILFIHEGRMTVRTDQGAFDCGPGDIVWLPQGTHLKYIAKDRAGYFYALYPYDWARRNGMAEP